MACSTIPDPERESGHEHCGCCHLEAESPYRLRILLVAGATISLSITLASGSFVPDFPWFCTASALITLGLTALPIFIEAVSGLFRGERNVCELAVLAIIGAVLIGERTTAAEISWILAAGELAERYVYARTRRDIDRIVSRHPRFFEILVNGEPVQTEAACIVPGNLVVVRPGDIIPVDGIIREGRSDLDESCMNGESLPVTRGQGDAVSSGSINLDGVLIVEATRRSSSSTSARIIALVREAGKRRPPSHPFIDRFSRWYTPVMLLTAGIVLAWTGSPVRAITVLIVACPCAVLLATPSAVLAAIGRAAREGILIKRGEYLEVCHDISAVIFDKTGTLSTGEMTVSSILPAGGYTREMVLHLAGQVEKGSRHPVAKAIAKEAERFVSPVPMSGSVRQHPGLGIEGMVDGGVIHAGSRQFMEETGVRIPESFPLSRKADQTEIFVAKNREYIGSVLVSDQLRRETRKVLSELSRMGIEHIAILTGDTAQGAAIMGEECGLPSERVISGLLPAEKEEYIARLQRSGKRVCFVGDGTNDGPALASADLGVSIAGREDTVAVESAGVVLMREGLLHLPEMLKLGRRTYRIIVTSICIALVLNLFLITAASTGIISPVAGVIGHQAATMLVLANSLRLVKRNPQTWKTASGPLQPAILRGSHRD